MRRILHLLPLLLFAATPVAAQEGGLLDPEPGLIIWTILIFVVVLVILYRAAFPHILGAVEAREAKIRDLLEEAARDREEAKAAMEQQKADLEETRAKVHELMAEGRTAGERVRDEIVGEARRQADDLLARTRRDVQQEFERARRDLRSDVVEIAVAAASKLVSRNLDQDDNRRLVTEYLEELDATSAATPAGR